MKLKTTLFTLTALIGAGALASAQEKAPGERPERGQRQPRELPAEIVKKYDKDGDGKLSEEERKVMQDENRAKREARQKEMLEKYDADKNGELSPEERKVMQETELKKILEKYDTDKDGKLSPEERQAAIAAGDFAGLGGGPGARGQGGEGRRGGRGPRPDGEKPAPAPAPAPAESQKSE